MGAKAERISAYPAPPPHLPPLFLLQIKLSPCPALYWLDPLNSGFQIWLYQVSRTQHAGNQRVYEMRTGEQSRSTTSHYQRLTVCCRYAGRHTLLCLLLPGWLSQNYIQIKEKLAMAFILHDPSSHWYISLLYWAWWSGAGHNENSSQYRRTH